MSKRAAACCGSTPSLPEEVACLDLSMRYREHWRIEVRIADGQLRVGLPPSGAAAITIGHRGELILVRTRF